MIADKPRNTKPAVRHFQRELSGQAAIPGTGHQVMQFAEFEGLETF
jgi:hypothetical protein